MQTIALSNHPGLNGNMYNELNPEYCKFGSCITLCIYIDANITGFCLHLAVLM
jgi:hypothetical protein